MQNLKQLNKEQFSKQLELLSIVVPNKYIAEIRKSMQNDVFTMKNIKSILNHDSDKQKKVILLDKKYKQNNFDQQCPQYLKDFIKKYDLEIKNQQVTLGYDNYGYQEILQYIIPEEVGVPTGFEQVGTLAHFNLQENQIPYQNIIGQVLLDKNNMLKTVVNKTEKLHNVYRTPQLELMAGEKNYEVVVHEGKVNLHLDFEKVYWCSRNQTERNRTLGLLKQTDTFLDIFCGVGPMAVRAAKLGCNVIANDLNPECYKYLLKNIKVNKVEKNVLPFCDDARKVVHNFMDIEYLKQNNIDKKYWHFSQVYMNLPVDNIEFLDCFKGLLVKGDPSIWNKDNLPTIHLYCFVKGKTEEECKELIEQRVQKQLPHFKKEDIIHMVNNKDINMNVKMFCITFKLRAEDALLPQIDLQQQEDKKIEEENNQQEQQQQKNQNNNNDDKSEDYENIQKKVKI